MGAAAPALQYCHLYWISSLNSSIRRIVRNQVPGTYVEVVTIAKTAEAVELAEENDERKANRGYRVEGASKDRSANISGGDFRIPEGIGRAVPLGVANPTSSSIKEDPRFLEFYNFMGDEIDIENMVKQFTSWKMLSSVEKDPVKLHSLVGHPKKKPVASSFLIVCSICKEGHHVSKCPMQFSKPTSTLATTMVQNPSGQRNLVCFACGEEGHYAKDCPKRKVVGTSSKVQEVESKSDVPKVTVKQSKSKKD